MKRRQFLGAASGALAGASVKALPMATRAAERSSVRLKKPNVLVIVCDQLSWKALPVYGNRYARTPNIDRIADRSVRFSRCYTGTALCMPTRASFWTGRLPHETGVLSNGRNHPTPPIPRDTRTLGSLFSDAGYHTAHFGKTHDAGGLSGFGHIEPVKEAPVEGTDAWPVNYDTKQDRYTTPRVVEFLDQHEGDSFLAVADLNNPHNICGWVGNNEGPHDDVPIPVDLPPLPPNFRDADFGKRPLPVQYICCSHNRLSQAAQWNERNYRHYLAAYHHYIGLVDAEIGLILDALESRRDADDTLVVFMADHGDGMGAHRMVTKQVSFIEETNHVPFMIAGPGVENAGVTLTEPLISLVDLLPTLCDYTGIQAPDGLWGRSLVPWLEGKRDGSPHEYIAGEWHTEWGYTISPGRMIRTPRYKYTRYIEGEGEELYDLQRDPGETRTLAGNPSYRNVLKEHRALLDDHVRETGDPFFRLSFKADPRWRSHTPG